MKKRKSFVWVIPLVIVTQLLVFSKLVVPCRPMLLFAGQRTKTGPFVTPMI